MSNEVRSKGTTNLKIIKKCMAVILTVSLLFFYSLSPLFTSTTYAQTVTDTPTPTPTAIDNSATTTTAADTTSNTGSNSIGTTPTPTDTPTPTPDPSTITPTPTPTIDPSSITPTDTPTPTPDGTNISNTAGVSNDTQSNANTGNNTATDSATTNDLTPPTNDSSGQNSNNSSSSAPNSAINTGNATSTTSIVNQVNTNSINSNVINQTLNIFVAQSGSINLSDPFSIAADAISTHPLDSVINVSVTSVNNYAYITNDIASQALTGQNLISTADQSASITTGNAYSIVSLLNQVNFTVVNSQIHLITINIFGNLNGNIILPDANASTSCSGCGVDTASINNTAAVTNNLNSTADTGNNSIVASGSATISTGDAQSIVNNLNVVNTNVSGTNAEVLYINDLGNWNGNFIGWGNFDPTAGGASLVFYNFDPNTNGSSSAQTNINNTAFVQNNVSSLALSGGNSINGGNSSIATGNSFSAISLMNFINTNFINSFGFFGFINIFGNWNGNIGGASEFAALNTPNPDTTVNVSNDSSNNNGSSDTAQEQGGQLSVGNTNNVGLYVLPGDTVTFFLTVKNTGTGKVYSTTLNLTLIHNGQSLGTASFALGDIPGGKGVKVTTGIVLPKNTPPGYYTAVAESTGNVGPNNSSVSASSDSNFTVFGNTIVAAASYGNSNYPKTAVLGSTNIKELTTKTASEDAFYLTLIVLLTLAYVSIKIVRKREYIYEVISSPSFKEKLTSMRMLLL